MTLAYPPSASMSISSLVDAQYMVSWAMGSRSAQPVFPARKDPKFPCNKRKFANEANPTGDYSGSITMESQSRFSDESKQDASTTHAHMLVLLEYLFENNVMKIGSTEWQDTDGCGKQYRCGTALYLLSLLASQKHVVIDRAIEAPGHGKDIVDGLNATDKRFLKGKMCLIGSPEANGSAHRMVAHSMVEGASKSLAEECAHLCSDEARTSGVKGSVKSEKRETNSKLKLRKYHVQQAETVKFRDLKMEVTGLPKKTKQSHNGLLAHYNIRVERDLGIGMAALRRIPCACDGCINQLDLKNVRARYASSITCKYWGIFEGLNDWKITKLVPASDDYEDDLDEAKQMVLH